MSSELRISEEGKEVLQKIVDDLSGWFVFSRSRMGTTYWYEVNKNCERLLEEAAEAERVRSGIIVVDGVKYQRMDDQE